MFGFGWKSEKIRNMYILTCYLLVSSADNFCKQFGPWSGPTKRRTWSGSNQFDTQMVFLKDFFEKVNLEKNLRKQKKHDNFSRGQRIILNQAQQQQTTVLWQYFHQGVPLTLNAPISTKVVCFSRLLICLRSLYGKQCGPRSDCSYRSSLFWVHTVCFYT